MRSNSEEWCIIFSCFKRSSWIQIWTSNVLSGFPHVLWTTCTIMRNTVNWWFSWACSGKIMRNPWNISNSYDQNPRTEGVGKQKHIAKHMKKWRTMYFWFFCLWTCAWPHGGQDRNQKTSGDGNLKSLTRKWEPECHLGDAKKNHQDTNSIQ